MSTRERLTLSLLLSAASLVAGCASRSVAVVDCGTDQACWARSFRSCQRASFFGGLMEIKEGAADSCRIAFSSGDDPQFTAGVRLTMECLVTDTSSYREDEMNGLGVARKGGKCTGALFDAYRKILGP